MKEHSKGYIYCVTNHKNGKKYVGQTVRCVSWRWKEHLACSFRESAKDYDVSLHKAIRKYGIDAFSIETLETCDAKDLDSKEVEWIAALGTYGGGYNMTRGGDSNPAYDDKVLLDLWDAGYCCSDIARMSNTGMSRGTARMRLLALGVSPDEIQKRKRNAISESNSKPVYQYGMDGSFIKSHISAREASISLGKKSYANICMCAQGNIKSALGYRWSYEKKERLEKDYIKNSGLNIVGKYSLDGTLLEMYVSMTAAANHNEISRKRMALLCETGEPDKGRFFKFIDITGGIIHV